MFNGIIRNTGIIKYIKKNKNSLTLGISSNLSVNKKDIGSSISCDGVCLTLISIKKKLLYFYLSKETINRSNYSKVKLGKIINIEKSLRYGDEISGHYTQGHVDTVGKVKKITIIDKTWIISIHVPKKLMRLIIEKASIHINGVSLTISKKLSNNFEINIIPHTLKLTNLYKIKVNDILNVEFDIFAKYILDLNN